jgi:diacylglycerol kinase family enzyme
MVVLTARTLAGWLAVALHVLLRRPGATARVIRRTCTEARVEVDRAHRWEIDGEVMGRTRELIVTVRPGALLVRVPATSPGGMSG